MRRSRNLTDKDIEAIVSILDGWTGKLTWDLLIDEVQKLLKTRPTRQGLDKHARIADAFSAKKKRLSSTRSLTSPIAATPELQAALEKELRLKAEIDRLNRENSNLLEQFVRWLHNANANGLTKEVLNRPLPPVDREKSLTAKPLRVVAKPKAKPTGPAKQD